MPDHARKASPEGAVAPVPPVRQRRATLAATRLQAVMQASPRVTQLLAMQQGMAARAVQRMAVEDEAPLQGKGLEDEEPLQAAGLEDEDPLQGRGLEDEEPLQGKANGAAPVQAQPGPGGNGGLPPQLQAGVEALSGHSMTDVRVHRNSPQPAQVGALAYAQGRDIHLGPGQEKHLPHEAWHVVQQAQGRVRPTMQAKGVAINDDAGLEAEADRMGAAAQRMGRSPAQSEPGTAQATQAGGAIAIQRLKASEIEGMKAELKERVDRVFKTNAATIKQNAPSIAVLEQWLDSMEELETPALGADPKAAAQERDAFLKQCLAPPANPTAHAWFGAAKSAPASASASASAKAQPMPKLNIDILGKEGVSGARHHYIDGWAAACKVTGDADLCEMVSEDLQNLHALGHDLVGEHEILLGDTTVKGHTKGCNVLYRAAAKAWNTLNVEVYHCGPAKSASGSGF